MVCSVKTSRSVYVFYCSMFCETEIGEILTNKVRQVSNILRSFAYLLRRSRNVVIGRRRYNFSLCGDLV